MDEPTSVLTPQEVGILFETLRKLSHEGTAILCISHKLEEIRTLCERATILRHGRVMATCDPREKGQAVIRLEAALTEMRKHPVGDEVAHPRV